MRVFNKNNKLILDTLLVAFENVLGRKFNCYDCPYLKNSTYSNCCKYFSFNRFNLYGLKLCKHFKLSKDIIEIIKLNDKEIENTKIDTHPRYCIGKITPKQSLDWFPRKDNKKILHNYINNITVKLDILL